VDQIPLKFRTVGKSYPVIPLGKGYLVVNFSVRCQAY